MKLATLADRFRKARKDAGLTQQELADRSGTTQDVINKIETGKSLRPRNIERLAKEMETSAGWLQFGIKDLDKLSKEGVEIAIMASKLPPEDRKVIESTIKALTKKES